MYTHNYFMMYTTCLHSMGSYSDVEIRNRNRKKRKKEKEYIKIYD